MGGRYPPSRKPLLATEQELERLKKKNMNETDLVYRLRKRAEIRRNIPRGEPDRISDILEEAAQEIVDLRMELERLTCHIEDRMWNND
jgi:succinate dehydrogenase/fumarate reductase flavoprotein subunit